MGQLTSFLRQARSAKRQVDELRGKRPRTPVLPQKARRRKAR